MVHELRFEGIAFMSITDVPVLAESLSKSPVAGGGVQRARDRPMCLVRPEKREWYERRWSSYPGPDHLDGVGQEC